MPTTFEPIISSDGFSGLAAQRQFWANHSRGVDEANLQRAAAAQEALNHHAMAVSEAQRSDAANAYNIQQQQAAQAMQVAERAGGDVRHDYEFGVNTGLAKDQIAVDKQRYQFAQKEKDLNEQKALDSIAKTAEFIAPDVADQGAKFEDAQREYAAAHQNFITLPSELEKDLPPTAKVLYNPKLNEFVPANPRIGFGDSDRAAVDKANAQLAKEKANYDAVSNTYQIHASNFDNTRAQAQKSGLLVGKRNGKWIVSSPNHAGKVFGDSGNAMAPVVTPAEVPDTTTVNSPFGQPFNVGQPSTDGTGTMGYTGNPISTPVAQSVQSPVKVGRFVVAPL